MLIHLEHLLGGTHFHHTVLSLLHHPVSIASCVYGRHLHIYVGVSVGLGKGPMRREKGFKRVGRVMGQLGQDKERKILGVEG